MLATLGDEEHRAIPRLEDFIDRREVVFWRAFANAFKATESQERGRSRSTT